MMTEQGRMERTAVGRRRIQTTLYSQCFSPCGKYLATGDNFGHVAVFNLGSVLSPDAKEETWRPFFTFEAHKGAVLCMTNTERLLISGGNDCIKAWLWNDITAKSVRPVWNFTIAPEERIDRFGVPETNSLALDNVDSRNRLLAGCGDNLVHAWDIESGSELFQLRGHTDYIHCVTTRNNGHECVTASEDGTVRMFDTRTSRDAMHIIEPYKNESCCRPQFGKYVKCVAVDKAEDWMVCGGGPQLCMWHLRSLAPTTVFDAPNVCANHVMFYEDTVISAGGEAFVRHWSVNGDMRAQVPCTPTTVYNVAINNKTDTNKVLSIAGNCHKVDICTNFGYKAFSMSVC